MSKKDNLIETISKNKQVNVLLWFVVAVVIVVVSFFLYKSYRGEQIIEDTLDGAIKKADEVLRADEVSVGQRTPRNY